MADGRRRLGPGQATACRGGRSRLGVGVRRSGRRRRRDRARMRHLGTDGVACRDLADGGEERRHRARARRKRDARLRRSPGGEGARRPAGDRRGAAERTRPCGGRRGRGPAPERASCRPRPSSSMRSGASRSSGRSPRRRSECASSISGSRRGRRQRSSRRGSVARRRRSSATRSSTSPPRRRRPVTASSASTHARAGSRFDTETFPLDRVGEAWARQASGSPGAKIVVSVARVLGDRGLDRPCPERARRRAAHRHSSGAGRAEGTDAPDRERELRSADRAEPADQRARER